METEDDHPSVSDRQLVTLWGLNKNKRDCRFSAISNPSISLVVPVTPDNWNNPNLMQTLWSMLQVIG